MATLADYNITVVKSMTTPSRPGKAPRPVWNVEGMTAGYEDILYSLGGKKWRGVYSFWTDPTDDLLEAIEAQGKTSFAERMEGKKERAEDRAERYRERAAAAEDRSEAAHQKFRDILDPIPFGQPILVGHHSERRHRKALERADSALGKAVEESDKAKLYMSKAAGANRTASDKDVGFMHRRLGEAEAELRRMQRHLADVDDANHASCRRYTPEVREKERARYSAYVAEQEEKAAYWKAQIEASGAGEVKDGLSEADNAKKASIKKGDFLYHDRGWWRVIRVNQKTVTAQCLTPGCEYFTPKIPFAEIEKVITEAQYAARQTEGGSDGK